MGWKDLSLKGELVAFRASDGAILSGILSRPKGSRIAVLHLHGLDSAFYRPLSIKLGNYYARKGLAFMSIQQRGSYKEYSLDVLKGNTRSRMTGGGGFERFEDSVYDINGAITYLKSVGIDRIYLQGHSTGCQKSVYYAIRKKDHAVRGLILLAPGDDYNGWKNDYYGILGRNGFAKALAFARSRVKKDPLFRMDSKYKGVQYTVKRFLSFADTQNVEARIFDYEAKELKEFGRVRVPVLAVFGDQDEHVLKPPKRYLEILGENTGSPDFRGVLIKGSSHGFFRKEAELAGLVGNWIYRMEKVNK